MLSISPKHVANNRTFKSVPYSYYIISLLILIFSSIIILNKEHVLFANYYLLVKKTKDLFLFSNNKFLTLEYYLTSFYGRNYIFESYIFFLLPTFKYNALSYHRIIKKYTF